MENLDIYRKERSEKALELRLKFALAFNSLLRKRILYNESLEGIKIKSAIMAGFGENSYCESAAYKTRRVMATRMMTDKVVVEKLFDLGLERHPTKKNVWRIKKITDSDEGGY